MRLCAYHRETVYLIILSYLNCQWRITERSATFQQNCGSCRSELWTAWHTYSIKLPQSRVGVKPRKISTAQQLVLDSRLHAWARYTSSLGYCRSISLLDNQSSCAWIFLSLSRYRMLRVFCEVTVRWRRSRPKMATLDQWNASNHSKNRNWQVCKWTPDFDYSVNGPWGRTRSCWRQRETEMSPWSRKFWVNERRGVVHWQGGCHHSRLCFFSLLFPFSYSTSSFT